MEGGRVIQLGTPQEIVKAPATDYVADFVSHMNPLNVLRARDIMVPPSSLPGAWTEGRTCDAETPIREVAKLMTASPEPMAVRKDGDIIGVIRQEELLNSML